MQILWLAADIENRRPRTADKGRSCSVRVVRKLMILTATVMNVTKCYTGPLVDLWNDPDSGKWTLEYEETLGQAAEYN